MKSGLLTLLRTTSAIAALAAASVAHAGGAVYYSVDAAIAPGVNVGVSNLPPPPMYVQPAPVLVAPRPVYVQPPPVYVQQPAYVVEYDGDHRHGHREHDHRRRHHEEHDEDDD